MDADIELGRTIGGHLDVERIRRECAEPRDEDKDVNSGGGGAGSVPGSREGVQDWVCVPPWDEADELGVMLGAGWERMRLFEL